MSSPLAGCRIQAACGALRPHPLPPIENDSHRSIRRCGSGLARIHKPGKEVHIDAIVALAMALDSAESQPEPVRLLGWL
jgi:hypothetical protein